MPLLLRLCFVAAVELGALHAVRNVDSAAVWAPLDPVASLHEARAAAASGWFPWARLRVWVEDVAVAAIDGLRRLLADDDVQRPDLRYFHLRDRLRQHLEVNIAESVMLGLPAPKCYVVATTQSLSVQPGWVADWQVRTSYDFSMALQTPVPGSYPSASTGQFLDSAVTTILGASGNNSVALMHLPTAGSGRDVFLLLENLDGKGGGISLTLARSCTMPDPNMAVEEMIEYLGNVVAYWYTHNCGGFEGLNTDARRILLRRRGPCRELYEACHQWSFYAESNEAASPFDLSSLVTSDSGARMAPDGKSLVLFDRGRVRDYLWVFGAGHAPQALHVPSRGTRILQYGPQFSADSVLLVTSNETHSLLFNIETGRRIWASSPAFSLTYPICGVALHGPLECD